MPGGVFDAIVFLWAVFYVFWLAAAFRVKRTERQESAATRIPYTLLIVAGFALVIVRRLGVGFLGWRFLPFANVVGYAGVAVTACGLAVAIWARSTIGRNWSSAVTIKQDHELIVRGPYNFVRHPIYTGMLLMVLGTAIAIGEIRGLVGFTLALAGFRMKSLVEEGFMRQQFGPQYAAYQRRVKALIPFIY